MQGQRNHLPDVMNHECKLLLIYGNIYGYCRDMMDEQTALRLFVFFILGMK